MTPSKLNHLAATKIMGWRTSKSSIGIVSYINPVDKSLVGHQAFWKPESNWIQCAQVIKRMIDLGYVVSIMHNSVVLDAKHNETEPMISLWTSDHGKSLERTIIVACLRAIKTMPPPKVGE